MENKYKTIQVKKIEDIKKAENLKIRGYKILSIGFNTIQFIKYGG